MWDERCSNIQTKKVYTGENYTDILKPSQFSSIQSTQSCLTLCDPVECSTPGLAVHHQLPELAQTHIHWVGDAIQQTHPLLSPSPPAFNLSQHQGLFQRVSSSIRWPKSWSFNFSISRFNEHPGLISFRMDWLDLLAVQGTHKSLPQHHSSKAPILWCSVFFIVQLSHQYMTTGKTIALTRWTFVGKVMSLLFNTLSRLVIAFHPGSRRLLISYCSLHLQWYWSPKKQSLSLFPLFPHLFAMKWWDQMLWSFFLNVEF